jgi:hypothetical protein
MGWPKKPAIAVSLGVTQVRPQHEKLVPEVLGASPAPRAGLVPISHRSWLRLGSSAWSDQPSR